MDERDELQQEKDIAQAWYERFVQAVNRIQELEAELAELKAKQTYASWGKKDASTST